MNKYSNLYDLDGNIINKSPQHNFTLEETEKLVDDLSKKVEEHPDNEVYKVYLNNAQKWLFKLYNEMSREELIKRMGIAQSVIDEAKEQAAEAEKKELDEINKAVEELKKSYEEEEKPVIMDEYVDYIDEKQTTIPERKEATNE